MASLSEAVIPNTLPTDTNEEVHLRDGINSLILCIILIISFLITYLISSKNWERYFPSSGATMIFGIVIGGILRLLKMINLEHEFTFSPEAFYFFLLPPIIFEAGYNMNKKNFFLNMGGILLYAIVGTLITAFVFGYFLYFWGKVGAISSIDNTNIIEALMFGSLISAIDPVATLSIMGSPGMNVHPTVYSLVFGESVLNDAVAIVLFRSFDSFIGKGALNGKDILVVLGSFAGVSLGAFCIGIGIGLLSALFFKHITSLRQHPYLEVALTLFFAYVSYLVAEICRMSGVMSLFLTGVVMKHYNWYSLSSEAQTTTYHLFKAIAFCTETFVFVYIGINVFGVYSFKNEWDPLLILFSLMGLGVSRACNIFPLSFIANLKRKSKITFKMQIMLWFSGLRGAVAFALALNVRTSHRSQVITTTLFLVLFTTLILGCLTAPVLRRLGLQNPETQEDETEALIMSQIGSQETDSPLSTRRKKTIPKSVSWAHRMWRKLDEKIMKPLFGGQPRNYGL